MRKSVILCLIALALAENSTAHADVLCKTKGGTVYVRTSCKTTETAVDPVALSSTVSDLSTTVSTLRNATFHQSANLTYANLSSADLSSANLISANLSHADLSHADLTSAFLAGADLSYANLYGANLAGAFLMLFSTGVTWDHTRCPDGSHSDHNGSSPESCCANMNGNVPFSCSP